VQISFTEFNPNQTITVESTGINSFTIKNQTINVKSTGRNSFTTLSKA
jgi:hypothetical protein